MAHGGRALAFFRAPRPPMLRRPRELHAFLLANCLERVASGGMTVLFGYQIYAISHRPLDLGWLGLAEAIPGVTLVLYGGHIADRHSRRRVSVLCTVLLAGLAVAIAALSGTGPHVVMPALVGIAFLSGVVRAFAVPAVTGLEAQVVPLEGLMRAVALLATTGRLADVSGPVIAGFAWAAAGARGHLRGHRRCCSRCPRWRCALGIAERPPVHLEAGAEERVWPRILVGIRYVFRDQVLVGSMALDLFAVFFGGATALLPAFATDILHAGPIGFGFLRAASGAGALTAAVLAVRVLPQRHAGWALHAVIGGFGVAIVVFGLSRSLPLSLACLFVAGRVRRHQRGDTPRHPAAVLARGAARAHLRRAPGVHRLVQRARRLRERHGGEPAGHAGGGVERRAGDAGDRGGDAGGHAGAAAAGPGGAGGGCREGARRRLEYDGIWQRRQFVAPLPRARSEKVGRYQRPLAVSFRKQGWALPRPAKG